MKWLINEILRYLRYMRSFPCCHHVTFVISHILSDLWVFTRLYVYHNMNVSHIEQLKETHVVYTCALLYVDVWWVTEVRMHATTYLEKHPFQGQAKLTMYYLTVPSPTNYITLK